VTSPPGAGCVIAHVRFDERDVETEHGPDNEAPADKELETNRPDLTHCATSRLYMVFPVLVKNVIDFARHRWMMTHVPFISHQFHSMAAWIGFSSLAACPSLHFTSQIAGIRGLVYKRAQTVSCRENLLA
jgi:hypothetical protein